ncbi:MAG TPA: TatD family hydrolase [Bacteroidales bacterium]|nr:TatD family hydrolase [Bacteroidales bacterium]
MSTPQAGDYINIHTHGSVPVEGIFSVENLMMHENIISGEKDRTAFSCGIHPWYINGNNYRDLLNSLSDIARNPSVIAIGECGFDRLRGPDMDLQRRVFEEQVKIAMEYSKPVIIHCVRSWGELLASHKRMNPSLPWMVHGFRRKTELAEQLLSGNMYLSFWFDFVIRNEATDLLRRIPLDRIFLETDGADVDIRDIYHKVSADLGMTVDRLKSVIMKNYKAFFNL